MMQQVKEKEGRACYADNKKTCMDIPEFICPLNAVRRYFGMRCKIPVETITADCSEEYKTQQVIISICVNYKCIGLIYHQHGTCCNKEIAVNEKSNSLFHEKTSVEISFVRQQPVVLRSYHLSYWRHLLK